MNNQQNNRQNHGGSNSKRYNENKPEDKKDDKIEEVMKKIKFLDNDRIPISLLDEDAMKIAKLIKKANTTTHQVRRFFDEVKQFQRLLENKKKNFDDLLPLIIMLKSKARYAATRKKEMLVFYDFIAASIDKIKEGNSEKSFEVFCLFFEAVYGFAELKEN
ncbi:MAG: type III-A CRISPR-associated protein Csm2 [Desulfobacteraceae bacterium]|jgi:CRISPR type III-A-associated protein Csm2